MLSAALYARDRGKKERAISILEQGNMYPQAAHFARELEFPEQEIRRLETKAIKALESEGSFYEAAVLAHGAGRHEKATTLFDKAVAEHERKGEYREAARIAYEARMDEAYITNCLRLGEPRTALDYAIHRQVGEKGIAIF